MGMTKSAMSETPSMTAMGSQANVTGASQQLSDQSSSFGGTMEGSDQRSITGRRFDVEVSESEEETTLRHCLGTNVDAWVG